MFDVRRKKYDVAAREALSILHWDFPRFLCCSYHDAKVLQSPVWLSHSVHLLQTFLYFHTEITENTEIFFSMNLFDYAVFL
jgi:hypothetical protein